MADHPQKRKSSRIGKFYRRHRKAKIAATVVLGLLMIFCITVFSFGMSKLAKINTNAGGDFTQPAEELYPEYTFDPMQDIKNASSMKELFKSWWNNNGQLMESKNVMNILLLGIDGEIDREGPEISRSDSMIVASINRKTKKVTLVSLLRDSYTFSKDSKQRYCKLNEAYFWGGPQALIQTIQNDYKIKIDEYVSVNFKTFPQVIDAAGGVDVEVSQAESDWLTKGNQYTEPIAVGAGMQRLNGEQALAYSRIRYLDNDTKRVERQRKVIEAMIRKADSASLSALNSIVDAIFPSIHTSCSKTGILSLAAQALTGGWGKYTVEAVSMPSEPNRKDNESTTYSYWVVDYPAAAREIQLALYGTTNIELSEDRTTAIDLFLDGLDD